MLRYIDEILGNSVLPKWILLGAYGRIYNTVEEAKLDFINGKDFMIYQGPYCSFRDWTGQELYIYVAGKFTKISVSRDEYKIK